MSREIASGAAIANLICGRLPPSIHKSNNPFIRHFPSSRRKDAIEPGGIIRYLRVAEIKGVGCERVGLERLPVRAEKIGAGFDRDSLAAGPIDIETE
jgi:hypothetical protein